MSAWPKSWEPILSPWRSSPASDVSFLKKQTMPGVTSTARFPGTKGPFDFRLRRADGSPVWVSISCMPMRDDAGAEVGLLGMFSDITERKQAEASIRDSEERFRAIFNLAAVGVAQVSLTAELDMVNDRLCAIFGYTREELIGRNLRELTYPDDLDEVVIKSRRLLTGEIPYFCMEKRHFRKDGTVIWSRMHKSCVRDLEGKPKHYIMVLEDVTEAAQAQAALRESEERFRNMADSASVLICLCNPNLNVTFCNQPILNFVGLTEDQLRGTDFKELIHPDDLQRVGPSARAAVQAQRVFEIELRMRRSDGEYRFMLTTGTPRFAAGTYVGYIMITVDITEFKRKQDYVLAMQKLESLGVLAGGIAHDFNNLLGGILASAEVISAASAGGGPPDEESLLRIKTSAIRGGEIVRQLMIYGGEDNQIFSSVDVPALVGEMLQLLKISISKRATLNVNFPARLPEVRANAAQLRQVVLNLITNASEALEDREGEISMSAAMVPGRDYQAPLLPGSTYLKLEVKDNGCGMTEEVQARIFDPFFTSKFAGRGMGLASVQGIVRSHGGTINVTSVRGQGSRFEILLPCAEPESKPEKPQAFAPVRRILEPSTVLLVEDEEPLRLAVSRILRLRGFTVIETGDGTIGVDLFREKAKQIDVVLLDLNLPGMSGREILRELKRIRPDAKVILTSAYSREWAQTAIGDDRSWPYIRKPYELGELTSLLRRVCAGSSE